MAIASIVFTLFLSAALLSTMFAFRKLVRKSIDDTERAYCEIIDQTVDDILQRCATDARHSNHNNNNSRRDQYRSSGGELRRDEERSQTDTKASRNKLEIIRRESAEPPDRNTLSGFSGAQSAHQ